MQFTRYLIFTLDLRHFDLPSFDYQGKTSVHKEGRVHICETKTHQEAQILLLSSRHHK